KSLAKSAFAAEAATERLERVVDRFPLLRKSRIAVTLSMENSPQQAGPDLFRVKVHCRGGVYHNIVLEKEGTNLHQALAEVVDHLQERLNRHTDKIRIKSRGRGRASLGPRAATD
ncbi:MAG TPA: HPF/RaiA family ribosome-associated protein, partial [Bdellovibrionales bacterium]|nr:HPF/RaiA family ribosome-associated protein [Bdellovibrionales bacterium]